MEDYAAKPHYFGVLVPLNGQELPVYASRSVAQALQEVAMDMDVHRGVQLQQLLEAVYEQGRRDGARTAFELFDAKTKEVKQLVPYRNPC